MTTPAIAPVIDPEVTPTSLASELEAQDNLDDESKGLEPDAGKETPPEDKTPTTPTPEIDPTREIEDFRSIIRAQRLQMRSLQEEMLKLQPGQAPAAAPTPKDERSALEEVFGESKQPTVETPAARQPSRFEMLQRELAHLGATKGPVLDTLVATMELLPQYSDVQDVCSRPNLDYLIDIAVPSMVAKEGVDQVEAALAIEAAIWRMSNPYKWIYEKVKELHPTYKSVTPTAESKKDDVSVPGKTPATKKPVEAPPSIVPLGGGAGDVASGWTAQKIDALDEEDYAKLPESIREKYLTGQLG